MWLSLLTALALVPTPAPAGEYRVFAVLLDGRPAGEYRLDVRPHADGSTSVTARAELRTGGWLGGRRATARVEETWARGRLRRLEAESEERGRTTRVAAEACAAGLLVTANGQTRAVLADAWTTTCWARPRREGPVALLDGETGRDVPAKLERVGPAVLVIGGKDVACERWRLTTAEAVDLWYDPAGLLARRESSGGGRRLLFELRTVGEEEFNHETHERHEKGNKQK